MDFAPRTARAWTVAHGSLRFELKRTPFGQIGLFPEQAENWSWIKDRVQGLGFGVQGSGVRSQDSEVGGQGLEVGGQGLEVGGQGSEVGVKEKKKSPLPLGEGQGEGGRLKILHLFAYTGASTLAAAAQAREVFHVDAAKNIVDWARRNAGLSGLENAKIHWITEDAMKFVKRELKRNARYDAVDPRSAQLRARAAGRSLAAIETSAASFRTLRQIDRRPMPVHSPHLPYPRLRRRPPCWYAGRDDARFPLRVGRSRKLGHSRRRPRIALRNGRALDYQPLHGKYTEAD